MNISTANLPVAVIGAGPVGMAAAAHLLLKGLQPLVLEAGSSVATSLEAYRHVRLFSPWRYNLDPAGSQLLESAGWIAPDPDALPTAGDIIDQYLQQLAALPAVAPHLLFKHRVLRISRQGFDKVKTQDRDAAPFVIQVATPGGEHEVLASAVIDAAGTWSQPSPLGANGLPARGESQLQHRIQYGMPDILGKDRARYAGKRILVAGAGHSAAGNLIALAELAVQAPGTHLVWALRGDPGDKLFGGGAADKLPARGKLGMRLKQLQQSGGFDLHTRFRTTAIELVADRLRITGEAVNGTTPLIDDIDEIIVATGARPDLTMTRELRLKLDSWLESAEALAPLIDPNLHSCGTVRPHGHRELAHPETGYYAVGAKSYGRAPNFLMATGYEQVRSVVAALVGDLAAADDIQLELPETGVCSVSSHPIRPEANSEATNAAGCCGGPAKVASDACCVRDEEAKAKGEAGCGCNPVQSDNMKPAMPANQPDKAAACCT